MADLARFGRRLDADSAAERPLRPRLSPMLYQTRRTAATLGIDARAGSIVWTFATHGRNYTHSTPAADPRGKRFTRRASTARSTSSTRRDGREMRAPGFPAKITRIPGTEANESPLNVANGYLYATSLDTTATRTPYDGHVVTVNLSQRQANVFNSLCSDEHRLLNPATCPAAALGNLGARGSGRRSRFVDERPRLRSDRERRVRREHGRRGLRRFGAALSADVSRTGRQLHADRLQRLQNGDVDLGSTSPTMLPAQPNSQTPWMLVQGGKDAVLKLLNRAALPGRGQRAAAHRPAERASSRLPRFGPMRRTTRGSSSGSPPSSMPIKLETNGSGVSKLVASGSRARARPDGEGTSPVVANGIVFIAFDGAIVASNATNGNCCGAARRRMPARTIGPVHWQSPIVVNGWVYCSDQSGNLTAYSLH